MRKRIAIFCTIGLLVAFSYRRFHSKDKVISKQFVVRGPIETIPADCNKGPLVQFAGSYGPMEMHDCTAIYQDAITKATASGKAVQLPPGYFAIH